MPEKTEEPLEERSDAQIEPQEPTVEGSGVPAGQVDAGPGDAVSSAEPEAGAKLAEDGLPKNSVAVEDVGTLRKKVTVEVPRERIDAKFNELFGELLQTAMVPGFRRGRAPRRLIEKRFGKEVAEDVRNSLVGEAVGAALEEVDFRPIGEPEIDLEQIELPEDGPLVFAFHVEAAPEFELPDYKGIEVRRPVVEVTDEMVDRMASGSREQFGKLRPVEGPIEAGDVIVADVTVTGEGIEQHLGGREFAVAPLEVAGIPLEDLPAALSGKRRGQECTVKTTVPSAHPTEEWRNKQVDVTFAIQEVKRMELPELDDDYARSVGFADLDDLRRALRERLRQEVTEEQVRVMADQVRRFLLDNTDLEIPEGMGKRMAARLLQRRIVLLMLNGVPRDEIERNIEGIEEEAAKDAINELKLAFIMAKLAEAEGIEVTDDEVNAHIAELARRHRRRPERLRQDLEADGTLGELTVAIRERKAIDRVLESARIVDVAAEDQGPDEQKGKEGSEK